MPLVKCDVCGNLTTSGLHQIRLKMVRKAYFKKDEITNQLVKVPPVMKRVDVYMCTNCVKGEKKWPGRNPIYPK